MHLPLTECVEDGLDIVGHYPKMLERYLISIVKTLEQLGHTSVSGMEGIGINIKTEKSDSGGMVITFSVDNGVDDDVEKVNAARALAISKQTRSWEPRKCNCGTRWCKLNRGEN